MAILNLYLGGTEQHLTTDQQKMCDQGGFPKLFVARLTEISVTVDQQLQIVLFGHQETVNHLYTGFLWSHSPVCSCCFWSTECLQILLDEMHSGQTVAWFSIMPCLSWGMSCKEGRGCYWGNTLCPEVSISSGRSSGGLILDLLCWWAVSIKINQSQPWDPFKNGSSLCEGWTFCCSPSPAVITWWGAPPPLAAPLGRSVDC